MRGTHGSPSLAGYRDAVAGLIRSGEPFGDVENAIDDLGDLSMDQKAALWLFAFSQRPASDQRADARAHLAAVE
ncbi:MAG: hypothetical protein ABR581_02275 [Thermoleophilaceae bacterium]